MKTDAKTMSLVLRRAARNIDRGLKPFKDIQYLGHYGAWIDMVGFDIDESVEYRIKPKTTIVNGVEIPEPLDKNEIIESSIYYAVNHNCNLFGLVGGDRVLKEKIIFVYKDQEEAIEASKKLFGIE